jgi:hypothetical protein
LVATCRKVSRCAAVAWHRRNIFRDGSKEFVTTANKVWLQQEFSAAGIRVTLRAKLAQRKGTFVRKILMHTKMMTLRAGLARRKGTIVGKNWFRDKVEQGTRTAGTRQEGKMDRKDLGCGRQYLRLRSMGKGDEIYRKTIRLDIGKRIARISFTTWKMWNRTTLRSPPPLERKIKEWTLWRGRPPPKRKKTY